ncbi:unnamed protein product [Parascedosporium putredinis]|uniref:FAD-binding PCMH-type domain-containing protein n=1 Tax=Parascedosporium putredinis TaxID=1442378 RepID=A0A9P1H087_9PEZI|nr:unnamed protein product [Parascedosporium putredinis]CAI7991554.1 unnamed protein product [Parascedosporium putredinis]
MGSYWNSSLRRYGLLLFAAAVAGQSSPSCKPIPGDDHWPSVETWEALNETISGRLIATVPVGSTCELGKYVSYSINVEGPDDVVAGIEFAKENDVRLVIKNTGHDYLGKSTGKGGLALWTHNLKDIEVIEAYESDYYTGPALKLGAGVQGWEAYTAASDRGYMVVGGTLYGLSADNVLEWEVVTAEGVHLVATPSENSDLYWALSGGGGGTFGIVLSMTTRLHEDTSIGGAHLQFDDSVIGHDAYWEAIEAFHSLLPPILAQDTSLLYSVHNNSFSIFSLTAAGKSSTEVIELLQPLLDELDARKVPFAIQIDQAPDSSTTFHVQPANPRAVLSDPEANAAVTRALREGTASDDFFFACQALDMSRNASVAANAVLPAWREAASHCIVVGQWDYSAVAVAQGRMQAMQDALVEVITPSLVAATPDFTETLVRALLDIETL